MTRRNNELMDALDLVLAAVCIMLAGVVGMVVLGAGAGLCVGTFLRMLAWMGV